MDPTINETTFSFNRSDFLGLIGLCMGFFMVMMDVTIVNVALPTIETDLNGNMFWLQWIVDAYTLTFACLLLPAGYIADGRGAKPVFIFGLVLFVVTSLTCALSTTGEWLVLFRLWQGAAAALVVPTSLSLIKSAYQTRSQQAKAIGIWGGIGGIAAAFGPFLGAMLTAWGGWRYVFLVNIPIGLLGIFLIINYVSAPSLIKEKIIFDWQGQMVGIASIGLLSFSLIEAGRLGWSSPLVIESFFLSLLTFMVFLFIEKKVAFPVFPLSLFKSKVFSTSIGIGMILNIGFYGNLFILPLYFQALRGYSVFMTGLAILPQPGLAALASYYGGKMASLTGPKLPILLGLTIGAVGFFSLLLVNELTPPYILLILPLAAIGFGTAFTMPAATIAALHSTPDTQAGVASGIFNTSRQVGSLMGVAIFGTIITQAVNFMSGMQSCLIIAGTAFLGGIIIVYLYMEK